MPKEDVPIDFTFEGAGWTPDLPDYRSPGETDVQNVYPRSTMSYGPVGDFQATTNAILGKRCQGMATFLKDDGSVWTFMGDANDLYVMSGGGNLTKVSKSPGIYSCPDDRWWSFEYFNGVIIAADNSDNTQAYTLGASSTFNDLASGTCPRASYGATSKNAFLVMADTQDNIISGPGYTENRQRIWWSPVNNPLSAWPTPGSVQAITAQSSYNDIFGPQGWVRGIAPNLANADAAIFFDHAVRRMIYSGPPDFFSFQPAQGVRGLFAPNSLITYGDNAFYLGEDGFYGFDGLNVTPLGANRLDKYILTHIDNNYVSRITGAVDPLNKMICWTIPLQGGAGIPNLLLFWNWQLNKFTYANLTLETISRLMTQGYTLDQLYTILGYTLDTLPSPLDSRVWAGGLLTFGGVNQNHAVGFLSGPNLAASITTSEEEIMPGRRTSVHGARPYCDGGNPSISIGVRETQQAPVKWTQAQATNAIGLCPSTASGRYYRAKMTFAYGSSWNHAYGISLPDKKGRGRV